MGKMVAHKFKYVGDPNDGFSGAPTVEYGGVEFVKGEETSVDFDEENENDVRLLAKLQGHSHFIDLSDKDQVSDAAQIQKDLDANAAAKEQREEAQAEQDKKDAEQREKNRAKQEERGGLTAATAPRPPGNVTRPTPGDPFQGRTVEERTLAEDHTKAGKTK